MIEPRMTHTRALRCSWLERLHFKLLGRWPTRVVERRLEALDRDVQEGRSG